MTTLEAALCDLALISGPEAQQVDHDHAPDGLTCAICLEQCAPEDIAMVKGCEHLYCVCCILKWACTREVATCPQCKMPFSYLWTHRMLDGSISDFPMEESLCLLKRAAWFTDHVRVSEFGPKINAAAAAAGDDYDGYEEEYDEEEEIERYYFSSAAGRARVVIGNRRWGENGSVRSGRMYARPVAAPMPAPAAKSGDKIGKAGKNKASSSGSRPSEGAGPSASVASSSKEPASSSVAVAATALTTPAPSSSAAAGSAVQVSSTARQQGAGRRAKRAARRRTADDEDDGGDPYDKYYDDY